MRDDWRRARRVLLLGGGDGHAVLAAARALHASGWTVGFGGPAPHAATVRSTRAVSRHHLVPAPGAGVDVTVRAVRRAVELGDYAIVLAAGDDLMGAVTERADQIPACVGHPPAPIVRRSLDKLDIVDLGESVGLATPRTVPATAREVATWTGPAVVKCRTHWVPERAGARLEAIRADGPEDLEAAVVALRTAGGDPVLQVPVEGDLVGLVGLCVDGRLVQRAQQRADVIWPRPTGVTARARTVPVDPDLLARSERFLDALGWQGPVQLEFLQPPGGEPVLIDVNGRIYGSLALARAAGLRIVEEWCEHLLEGSAPREMEGRVGVPYRWLEGDLRAGLAGPAGRLSALRATWSSGRGAVGPLWDRRDPLPALRQFGELVTRAARRVIP